MHRYPFGEHVLDERASFCPHLLELRGGIDQEVEPGPDVVDGDEVEIPFQEGAGCLSHDDQVEVAPLVSIASRNGAEHERLPRLWQVGRQAPLQRVEVPDDDRAHDANSTRGVPVPRDRVPTTGRAAARGWRSPRPPSPGFGAPTLLGRPTPTWSPRRRGVP